MAQVEIITIGDELLIGQIIDTNSAWLAQQLNLAGFAIKQITSVSDNREHILQALELAESRANIIITTGGLGPTADDITKPAFAEYFQSGMRIDGGVLADVTAYLTQKGRQVGENNRLQALVPEKCTVIRNHIGTAPVMWFEKNDKVFISLPGVPFEMKELSSSKVIPKLKERFKTPKIYHKTVMTNGLPESVLADKIKDWADALPEYMKLAYLPSPETVRLRISVSSFEQNIENMVNEQIDKLQPLIGKYIFAYNDEYLQETIGKILSQKNATMATAESCTGGSIAQLITSIAGSSQYYKGSIVAYANETKMALLDVPGEMLEKFGAVSKEVAEAMAKGAIKRLNTDFAVATTGIAGPDGGTPEKPVGTVWIVAASKDKVISRVYTMNIKRDINMRLASSAALQLLRFLILEIE
jgi:nicotinamide-nucleotide amidase